MNDRQDTGPTPSTPDFVERVMASVVTNPRPSTPRAFVSALRERSAREAIDAVSVAWHLASRAHAVPVAVRVQALLLVVSVALAIGTGATLAATAAYQVAAPVVTSLTDEARDRDGVPVVVPSAQPAPAVDPPDTVSGPTLAPADDGVDGDAAPGPHAPVLDGDLEDGGDGDKAEGDGDEDEDEDEDEDGSDQSEHPGEDDDEAQDDDAEDPEADDDEDGEDVPDGDDGDDESEDQDEHADGDDDAGEDGAEEADDGGADEGDGEDVPDDDHDDGDDD